MVQYIVYFVMFLQICAETKITFCELAGILTSTPESEKQGWLTFDSLLWKLLKLKSLLNLLLRSL